MNAPHPHTRSATSAAKPRCEDRASATSPISVSRVHRESPPQLSVTTTAPRPHQYVTHTYAALAYFTEGHSTFEQKGTWNVSPGDVLLVPAGEPHRRSSNERASYWGLGLSVPCYAQDAELQRVNPFERVRDGGAAVVRIPDSRRNYLEHLLTELAAVTRETSANLVVQRSLLYLVLNEVWTATSPTETSTNNIVTSSLRFIERHCLMPITLKDVAAAVGKSAAYVTTTLSQHTGQSAVEWIISGRMAEARRLLLHSSQPVGDIAYRVGYADATHFIRLFRRIHGLTPAAYRNRSPVVTNLSPSRD